MLGSLQRGKENKGRTLAWISQGGMERQPGMGGGKPSWWLTIITPCNFKVVWNVLASSLLISYPFCPFTALVSLHHMEIWIWKSYGKSYRTVWLRFSWKWGYSKPRHQEHARTSLLFTPKANRQLKHSTFKAALGKVAFYQHLVTPRK